MDSAAGGVATANLGRKAAAPRLRSARLFYPGLAVAMFVIVFAGFAPTYYLKSA